MRMIAHNMRTKRASFARPSKTLILRGFFSANKAAANFPEYPACICHHWAPCAGCNWCDFV